MDSIDTAIARDFGLIADLIRLHARRNPDHIALRDDTRSSATARSTR